MAEDAMINQNHSRFGKFEGFSIGPFRLVEHRFVPLAEAFCIAFSHTTVDTAHAVSPQVEVQRFIPVTLFFGEEDEVAAAVSAFTLQVKIVSDRNRCIRLAFGIRGDRGLGNAFVRTGMPTEVNSAKETIYGIKSCVSRASSIPWMVDKVSVNVGPALHGFLWGNGCKCPRRKRTHHQRRPSAAPPSWDGYSLPCLSRRWATFAWPTNPATNAHGSVIAVNAVLAEAPQAASESAVDRSTMVVVPVAGSRKNRRCMVIWAWNVGVVGMTNNIDQHAPFRKPLLNPSQQESEAATSGDAVLIAGDW